MKNDNHPIQLRQNMKATFKEIMSQLEKRNYAPVYFLTGAEPLYIDKIANYVENNVMDEASRDFNQAVFYGKDTTIDDVIASAKEFPFGVDRRVVIVKEAQNWNNLDALKKYVQNALDSTLLVVCYKADKLKTSEKTFLEKDTVFFNSAKVPDYKLGEWVATCALDHGFKIAGNSANVLAEHIGNDLSRIDHEFEKLKLMIPAGSEVTTDIIEKYIGISKQYNVYELRDALINRDEVRAYKIVNAFSQNLKNNSIIGAIASLSKYYGSLLAYHLTANKAPDELKAIFGYNLNDRQIAREAGIANRYSQATLIKIIATLREFDARAKGVNNTAEDDQLYKELIYRILH